MIYTLYLLVMLPIAVGLLLYVFNRFLSRTVSVGIQVILLCLSVYYVLITQTTVLQLPLLNVPLPYGMMLEIDELSAVMLLLNNLLFLTFTIFSYHKNYMNRLFLFLFLSLQGLINALFMSTDFFNIYILIEVATITVSVLIMFKKDRQSMYDGMLYLTVNMIGMAFFLFGVGLLYKSFGVLDFKNISLGIQNLSNPKALNLAFSFLLTGIGLKAAILPLFSWLPKAHGTASAPSIVSAVLSGIFVKVGVYMLIRLQFMFAPIIDMQAVLLVLGFTTAIAGFIFAISQEDIKLILAYHTISQIGLILIGLGGTAPLNYQGGVYHLLSHGIFKSLFFILAGVLSERFKTRKITKMKGLWQISKPLSCILLIAVFSITGAPFFSGGYSKYFISYGYPSIFFKAMFILVNLGTMISFIKFLHIIFIKTDVQASRLTLRKNEWFALGILASACIMLGLGGNIMSVWLLHEPMNLSPLGQLIKWPSYVINYALAFALYTFWLKKSSLLHRIRRVELTFNSINIAIVTFFFVTFTFLNYVL